ncbi:MAG: uridine kinase, partial [Bacteroidales bacterium]|nr:uridine kinase [Bacteroidales bacterium]
SSHLTPEQKAVNNFDHPNSIDWDLLVSDLAKLRSGQAIESPVYSYITCSRSTTETVHVEPATIIIVEGILIFTNEELRKLFDISIFVDADADDRLGRVIQRDIEERGKTVQQVLKRYQETVKPMHLQFIEPSKRYADIIVPQGGHNRVAISIIIATIEKALLTRGE